MRIQPLSVVDRTPEGGERRRTVVLTLIFAGILALAAIDVALDWDEGTDLRHVWIEGGILLAGFAGLAAVLQRFARLSVEARLLAERADTLTKQLEASAEEAIRWRQETRKVLDGLGAAIDRQFARWELSPAEKEVALLLLKGLSHKEIAEVRQITEATTRQQARAVYKKAGLSGRHDLAAFFLEDLLLPPEGDSLDGRGN